MRQNKMPMGHGKGPMGPGKGHMKLENPGKTLKRLMAYIFKNYKLHCIVVFSSFLLVH